VAEVAGPGVDVALAGEADEHRAGAVVVRLGVAAVLVLADEEVEAAGGHVRLDAPVERALVVERQVAVHHVGDEVRDLHRPAAVLVHEQLVVDREVVAAPRVALAEDVGVVEDERLLAVEVEQPAARSCRRAARRARGSR